MGYLLSTIFWINGRNSRTQWWLIELCYGAFIAYLLITINDALPHGSFETLSAYNAGNLEEARRLSLADAQRQAEFGNTFDWTNSLATKLALPIWWLIIVNNVRRYHDRNKSGWYVAIMFIPLIGPIWQLIELGTLPGDDGTNDYGPPPWPTDGRTRVDREVDDLRALYEGEPKRADYLPNTTTVAPTNIGQAASFGKRT